MAAKIVALIEVVQDEAGMFTATCTDGEFLAQKSASTQYKAVSEAIAWMSGERDATRALERQARQIPVEDWRHTNYEPVNPS